MKLPSPIECLVIHCSIQAALTSAFAPMFDNNPAEMAPLGFVIGFITGLPVYVVAVASRGQRRR